MRISVAKLEANRKNALLSTGPRTPEGKEKSRANALKHGLCSSVVIAEDANAVYERSNKFYYALKPQNHFHCWLVSDIALGSLRIDRCERMERRARDLHAIKAELNWEGDRKLEAELLGEHLGNRPAVVVEQLRQSLHGCDWLIRRWAMLACVADVGQGWTVGQTELAFDLLGTPHDFRTGRKPGTLVDSRGQIIDPGDDLAALARREIDELEERREMVADLDEAKRALAMADLNDNNDPEVKRLHRYEANLQRHLRWSLGQLRYQSPLAAPLTGLYRFWLGDPQEPPTPTIEPIPQTPIPDPEPEKKITAGRFINAHPPIDLEPHEVPKPGEKLDVAKVLAGRRSQKQKEADGRRDVQRRKLEKLRA